MNYGYDELYIGGLASDSPGKVLLSIGEGKRVFFPGGTEDPGAIQAIIFPLDTIEDMKKIVGDDAFDNEKEWKDDFVEYFTRGGF